MTHAEFTRNGDNIVLKVNGHAGAAGKGMDVVCSAASILAYTVAQTLQFMYEEGQLRKKPHLKLDEGDTVIAAKPKAEFYAEALHTFFVAQVGYHLLSYTYPQYVGLTSFGKADMA